MTSSSSTSGSGSLSSQSVPSSMDSGGTLPTQDVVDGYFSEPEEAEPGWGKLIPVGRGFELIGKYSLIICRYFICVLVCISEIGIPFV